MIRTGMQAFVQLPAETARRILHATDVTAVNEGVATVRPGPDVPTIDPGDELLLYYEVNLEFMKHPCRVADIVQESEDGLELHLELIGQPISAESRQCYRVVTALCDLTATIGEEGGCRLVDASVSGFAVIAKPGYKIGANMAIMLRYEGSSYGGNACLQSVTPLDAKRTRYGFSSTEPEMSDLANGLRAISLGVQRQQLRRLSGAA